MYGHLSEAENRINTLHTFTFQRIFQVAKEIWRTMLRKFERKS